MKFPDNLLKSLYILHKITFLSISKLKSKLAHDSMIESYPWVGFELDSELVDTLKVVSLAGNSAFSSAIGLYKDIGVAFSYRSTWCDIGVTIVGIVP